MKKLYIFASILLISASCMKNTDIIKDKLVTLSVTPSVSLETTKALVNTLGGSDMLGIQVTTNDGNALYAGVSSNLIKMTGTSMANTVYLSSNTAKIFAYYPYNEATIGNFTGIGTSASPATLQLPIDASQTMASQTDFLWAAQSLTNTTGTGVTINNAASSVDLKMAHALSQVSFVFYKENFSGTGAISQIVLSDVNSPSKLVTKNTTSNDLKMKLADGTITGGTASSVTITSVEHTISSTPVTSQNPEVLKSEVDAYALVVPATFANKSLVKFTFTIDGKNYQVPVSIETTELKWEQGKQYIYVVKLSGTAATISSVTVTDWTRSYGGGVVIQ